MRLRERLRLTSWICRSRFVASRSRSSRRPPPRPCRTPASTLREHDLVELVRIGQKLVVVELHQERDLVGVLARDRAEHAERRRDGVAAAFDRELDDVLRVEVDRVRGEARAGGVLDALIDRQDRNVARAASRPWLRSAGSSAGPAAAVGREARRDRRSPGPAGAAWIPSRTLGRVVQQRVGVGAEQSGGDAAFEGGGSWGTFLGP